MPGVRAKLATWAVCCLMAQQTPVVAAQPRLASPPAVPAFGLMYNDDGGGAFTHPTVDQSIEAVKRSARLAATAGINTYVYCTGSGTKIHPTRAGSSIGWRTTKYDDDSLRNYRAGIAAGVHVIPIAAEGFRAARARLAGPQARAYFFISHRISDDHMMYDPAEYPSTERFQLDHPHLIIGPDKSPVEYYRSYGNLVDFAHAEVRAYKLAVMFEEIELYGEVIDGYEIDFTRSPFLFARGAGPGHAGLVTEMLEAVRNKLTETAIPRGRPLYLMVRVPPSLACATWAGLDVRDWMTRRLVDVVVPAHVMIMAPDLPLPEFLAAAGASGAKVYAAVQLRTGFYWPFQATRGQEDYARPVLVSPSAEDLAGAALNHLAMGTHGIQLFNMGPIYTKPGSEELTDAFAHMYRVLADPVGHRDRASFIFPITGYNYYRQDGPEYLKPIPTTLQPGVAKPLRLYVGMDLSAHPERSTLLRLGFRQIDVRELRVTVKGRAVLDGPLDDGFLIRPNPAAPIPDTDDLQNQPPRLYVRAPISPEHFRLGWNEIEILVPQRADLLEVKVGSFARVGEGGGP